MANAESRSNPSLHGSRAHPIEDRSSRGQFPASMNVRPFTISLDGVTGANRAAIIAAMREELGEENLFPSGTDDFHADDRVLHREHIVGDIKSERWMAIAEKTIDKLLTFEYYDMSVWDASCERPLVTECTICMCNFKNGDFLRELPCGHCFHVQCVDPWLQGHNSCPCCRKVIAKV